MIAYNLVCDKGHEFESWFASSAAYDRQVARGLVACPLCASTKVGKAVMAPAVARRDRPASAARPQAPIAAPADSQPMAVFGDKERQLRDMVRALRQHVKENSDYVGRRFSEEARQMHEGEIEHRSIWGEASAEEAKALIEDGIEVHPLPLPPDDRN